MLKNHAVGYDVGLYLSSSLSIGLNPSKKRYNSAKIRSKINRDA